jgi:hypothetical protein
MHRRLLAALALVALLAGCTDAASSPRPRRSLEAARGYIDLITVDRPTALWPLAEQSRADSHDVVAELVGHRDGVVVGGRIGVTDGPRLLGQATAAAEFAGHGRIVTPVQRGFARSDSYTLELWLRYDDCTTDWGRVAGTVHVDHVRGREGVDVISYPQQAKTPCSVGVEYWQANAFRGGCVLLRRPARGVWQHLAVTYDGKSATCWANGQRVQVRPVSGVGGSDTVPFGIGGASSGWQGGLNGASLSNVAIYDHLLTPAQIARHAAAGS